MLLDAFALAWEAVTLLSEVWRETPRYSDRYHLFRLVAHLAKYWTAEVAVQSAKPPARAAATVGRKRSRIEASKAGSLLNQALRGRP